VGVWEGLNSTVAAADATNKQQDAVTGALKHSLENHKADTTQVRALVPEYLEHTQMAVADTLCVCIRICTCATHLVETSFCPPNYVIFCKQAPPPTVSFRSMLMRLRPTRQAYNALQQLVDSNTDSLRSLSQSTDQVVQALEARIDSVANDTMEVATRVFAAENAQATMRQDMADVGCQPQLRKCFRILLALGCRTRVIGPHIIITRSRTHSALLPLLPPHFTQDEPCMLVLCLC